MMNDWVYGIDFGTTNSAVSIIQNNQPVLIPIGHSRKNMIRSVLYFPNQDDSVVIGDAAFDRYLDDEMDGRLIQSIKTILPSYTFKSTQIRKTNYDAVDLVSLILRFLKQSADAFLGADVRKAVIGRPARFSDLPRDERLAEKRLREAAENAGFEEIFFQYEPVAAAISYELTLKEPERVIVADLGGGTSDFALMELSPDKVDSRDRSTDVIATRGLSVAGDVFDSRIMHHNFRDYLGGNVTYKSWPDKWLPIPSNIFADLCHKGRIIQLYHPDVIAQIAEISKTASDREAIRRLLKLLKYNLGYALFQQIETAKCRLSDMDQVEIAFHRHDLELRTSLSRTEFEGLISEEITKIRTVVESLLMDAGVDRSQIKTVFMTGGTSLVPIVQYVMAEMFGAEKIRHTENAFTSVVSGLALSGKLFF